MQALGMIEVIGLPPAIEAADSALKAANVTLLAIAKADAGILTVEIVGDVGAVTAAVDAGAAAAERVGTLRARHVIPHVDESLVGRVIMNGAKLFQPKKNPTMPISQSVITGFSNSQEDGVLNVDSDNGSDIANKETGGDSEENVTENRDFGIGSDVIVTDNGNSEIGSNEISSENRDSGIGSDVIVTDNGNSEIDKEEIVTDYRNSEIRSEESGDTIEKSVTTYTVTDLKKKSNDTLRSILQNQGVELTEFHKKARKQELIQLIIAQQNRR